MNELPTVVSFILDESGSMESVRDAVISGYNEYIHSLGAKSDPMLFTLTKFDSNGIRVPFSLRPVADVPPLNRDSFTPGAMTPLYDAVCLTIRELERNVQPEQPVLVVIMTDGMENSSKEYTEKNLHEMIKRLDATGHWTFTFMGANQDSWAVATKFGIQAGNIANWDATPAAAPMAFNRLADATASFSERVRDRKSRSVDDFFEPDDSEG